MTAISNVEDLASSAAPVLLYPGADVVGETRRIDDVTTGPAAGVPVWFIDGPRRPFVAAFIFGEKWSCRSRVDDADLLALVAAKEADIQDLLTGRRIIHPQISRSSKPGAAFSYPEFLADRGEVRRHDGHAFIANTGFLKLLGISQMAG